MLNGWLHASGLPLPGSSSVIFTVYCPEVSAIEILGHPELRTKEYSPLEAGMIPSRHIVPSAE